MNYCLETPDKKTWTYDIIHHEWIDVSLDNSKLKRLVQDSVKVSGNVRHARLSFKKSMIWEKEIADFVASHLTGYSINVPCGSSVLGSVRVDLDSNLLPDKIEDMKHLSFPDCVFDSAVQDPPWKLNFYQRMKPFFELIRVVKVGGTIIYNAPWIPTSKAVRLEEVWIRQSAQFGNTSILSVMKCPFCPCEFSSLEDYTSHIRRFGWNAQEHIRLFYQLHKNLEWGIPD